MGKDAPKGKIRSWWSQATSLTKALTQLLIAAAALVAAGSAAYLNCYDHPHPTTDAGVVTGTPAPATSSATVSTSEPPIYPPVWIPPPPPEDRATWHPDLDHWHQLEDPFWVPPPDELYEPGG